MSGWYFGIWVLLIAQVKNPMLLQLSLCSTIYTSFTRHQMGWALEYSFLIFILYKMNQHWHRKLSKSRPQKKKKTFSYNENRFIVYEIYPESTSPQIEEIAHIVFPGLTSFDDIQFYSLSYDCIIFLYVNVLTIWDYKAHTWARWAVEGYYHRVSLSSVWLKSILIHLN